MSAESHVYDEDFRLVDTLRDGSHVTFRLVRPEDKHLLVEGLERMSPESRYRRFFANRAKLSRSELAYLTEVDQDNHFAIGAGLEFDDGSEVGLGVARFVRLSFDPFVAEAAVAVIDDWQGKGVGGRLLAHLINAARERGLLAFRMEILADNAAMLSMLREFFPDAEYVSDEGVLIVTCPLPDPDTEEDPSETRLYQAMKLAAEGAARVLRSARAWPIPADLEFGEIDEDDSLS